MSDYESGPAPGDEAWQGTDDAVKRPNCHPATTDQPDGSVS